MIILKTTLQATCPARQHLRLKLSGLYGPHADEQLAEADHAVAVDVKLRKEDALQQGGVSETHKVVFQWNAFPPRIVALSAAFTELMSVTIQVASH